MIIDDFDWDKLYEKADVFMRNSNVRTFNVQKGERTLYANEPIVTVDFPKRNNTVAILSLDNTYGCVKRRGFKKDGILYCVYGLYINKLTNWKI